MASTAISIFRENVENHGGITLTGENSRFVHQISLEILLAVI
jgi:hypothetical protein